MIKYILSCSNSHEFEAWFSSEKGFFEQNKNKQINCPYCSVTEIERNVGGPSIITSSKRSQAQKEQKQIEDRILNLKKLRKYVETNYEFIGDGFSQAARDLHEKNKSKSKNSDTNQHSNNSAKTKKMLGIYGHTNADEYNKLKEDGVAIQEIPWIKREDA